MHVTHLERLLNEDSDSVRLRFRFSNKLSGVTDAAGFQTDFASSSKT